MSIAPETDNAQQPELLLDEIARLRALVEVLEQSEPFSYDDCRPECDCADHQATCGCHVTGAEARQWIRDLETERDGLLIVVRAASTWAAARAAWAFGGLDLDEDGARDDLLAAVDEWRARTPPGGQATPSVERGILWAVGGGGGS